MNQRKPLKYTKKKATRKHMATWISWNRARQRCNNPKQNAYSYYGGRGIAVCDRWRVFRNFLADMGPRPPGFTLERINNNGNYEPNNCKWASRLDQGSNKRNNKRFFFNGQNLTLPQWSRALGIPYGRLQVRLQLGWSVEDALTTPKLTHGKSKTAFKNETKKQQAAA